MTVQFVNWDFVRSFFGGKSVAIVGSGPSILENSPGFIDSHDIVVRVNNFRCINDITGHRVTVHYSFFGGSIRKESVDLKREGVKLCICKCPNSKPLSSKWHERNKKMNGVDFQYIYRQRAKWWFCVTFIPDDARFLRKVALLDGRIPTTGFAAILDVLDCEPKSVFLTGFDGFKSGLHNVNEVWRPGDPADPIGHRPELELAWLKANAGKYPLTFDKKLQEMLA